MSLRMAFVADALRVRISDSREAMGLDAARAAGECIRALLREKEEISMIFAAAPSQNETLCCLAREEGIDWSRVHAFHMDEYVGLSPEAPQSFGCYLREHVFSRLPFRSVNYLRGDAPDAQAECGRYGALLDRYPVRVKVVPLDPVCRLQQVHDGCFERLEQVPERALTLTIPALARAGHLFCTVPAATKREAVTHTVTGPIGAQVPATVMRRHPDATLFCDPDSAADLLRGAR